MREPLRLTLAAGPAKLPLSLNEVKDHLRIEDSATSEDALLTGYLGAAVQACESFTGRALVTQTWTLFRDDWPAGSRDDWWDGVRELPVTALNQAARALELPKPPLQSVVHVKTYDDTDAATTYAVGNYFMDTASEPGRIVLRTNAAAPAPSRAANGLEIQFTAGYGGDPGDVPEELRAGMLMLVAQLFEQREPLASGNLAKIPLGVEALWRPFRILRL